MFTVDVKQQYNNTQNSQNSIEERRTAKNSIEILRNILLTLNFNYCTQNSQNSIETPRNILLTGLILTLYRVLAVLNAIELKMLHYRIGENNYSPMYYLPVLLGAELQIRRGNRDNTEVMFLIAQ